MEAHVADEVRVSKKDVDRVEAAIRSNRERHEVFPRLGEVGTEVAGEGLTVAVRFVKRDGLPVRYVASDDPAEAAALREVDLQKKYHWSSKDLAQKLDLTHPRAIALRRHLEIDDDTGCAHTFEFGKMKIVRYSDNALMKMRAALETVDMDDVWRHHGTGRKARGY